MSWKNWPNWLKGWIIGLIIIISVSIYLFFILKNVHIEKAVLFVLGYITLIFLSYFIIGVIGIYRSYGKIKSKKKKVKK
jgi:UDP-N-acetylmuramyl pentapeptide phosphotransferase/UDP-N-acetylglucosamine-1-phosphate transferase